MPLARTHDRSKRTFQLWDTATDNALLPDRALPRERTARSADGSRQAVWQYYTVEKEYDPEIRIRDHAGKQIVVFSKHTTRIASTVFSPDSRLVFSRAGNSEVKLWQTETGKVRWEADLATWFGATDAITWRSSLPSSRGLSATSAPTAGGWSSSKPAGH